MTDRRIQFVLLAGTAGVVGLMWLTTIPLGIPGEWVWSRVTFDGAQVFECLLACLLACVAAVVYLAVAWAGASRIETCSPAKSGLWLCGLGVAGFGWLVAVQESPPSPHDMTKTPWVLYYAGPSGYFSEARYAMPDVRSFLAGYEHKMQEGDVLHVGTHPPGLFLFHKSLISLCRGSTEITRFALATQPPSVREGLDVIDVGLAQSAASLDATDRAALWLAALITQCLAIATIGPLYLLMRRSVSRRVSWMAVSFWPLLPSLALFLPKSDALFPFLGTIFLAAWLTGFRRQSALLCVFAGLFLWCGMFLSLAVLPYALLAVLLTIWDSRISTEAKQQSARPGKEAVLVVSALVGFVTATVAVGIFFDANLLEIWKWNFRNHAGFYEQYPRTYWKWLLVNPVETVFAAGWPIAWLVLVSYGRAIRKPADWRQGRLGVLWACAIVAGLLWVSGKNMGEVARLWILFLPWLIWILSYAFQEPPKASAATAHWRQTSKVWFSVLVLQAVICWLTVTRVTGFDFVSSLAE